MVSGLVRPDPERGPASDRGSHEGPCLNYPGQDPEHYSEYDSCYRHIEASERRWAELEAIVRDLASPDWGRPYNAEDGVCMLCGTEDPSPFIAVDDDYSAHAATCPWRRAREWVAGHG